MYPAIQIGQILLPTLHLALAFGMITAVIFSVARAGRYGIGRTTAFVGATAALLMGVAGDRSANCLLLASLGWTVPSMSIAAGVALAALAVKGWSLMVGARCVVLADCFSRPITLGLVVAGFGCLLAGCDYGQPTRCPWGIVFNNALALAWYRTPIGVRLHPTQLYECLLAVLLFLLLKAIERYKLPSGSQFLVLAAGYAFGRYFIEFLRGDGERGSWGPLSVPQWFCALTLVVSVTLLTQLPYRKVRP